MCEKESQVIRSIRFPLIILVIMVHTDIGVDFNSVPFTAFQRLLSIINGIAVPVFFLISGFLFFVGWKGCSSYKGKIVSRVRTLLIPYLCWNALYMLYIMLIQTFFPAFISSERKLIVDYTLGDFINSFWNYGGVYYGMPILYSFWYIRDLMVLCLCAIPIYYLVQRKKALYWIYLIIILALFMFNPFHFSPTDMDWVKGVFFFSLGAWLSLNHHSIIISPLLVGVVLGAFLIFLMANLAYIEALWCHQLLLLMGTVVTPSIYSYIQSRFKCKQPVVLSDSVIFVYAFHLFIIMVFNKFWSLLFPVNEYTSGLMLIMIPIVTAFTCVGVFVLLKYAMPRITNILIGGRLS